MPNYYGRVKPAARPATRSGTRSRPRGSAATVCEFCRESILWAWPVDNPRARTEAGRHPKPMPLDPEPSASGNFVLSVDADGRTRVGEMKRNQADGFRASGGKTYDRHFRTCTKSDEWGRLGKPYGHAKVQR